MKNIITSFFVCFGFVAFGQVQPYEIEYAPADNYILLSKTSPSGEYDHEQLSAIGLSEFSNDLSLGDFNYWTKSGTDLYYATGAVGIGTSSPTAALHVLGNAKILDASNNTILNGNSSGGLGNISIGIGAGSDFTSGSFGNTATGLNAASNTTSGAYNSAYGANTMFSNTTGDYNTALGYNSLYDNVSGDENVALGYLAGYNSEGDSSVYIGSNAGFNNTSNNRLYIANRSNDSLIYGEFDNRIVKIGGKLGYDTQGSTATDLVGIDADGNLTTTGVTVSPTADYLEIADTAAMLVNYALNSDVFSGAYGDLTGIPTLADLNYWTLSGSNVYRSSGNVGIGTTSPDEKFHVATNGSLRFKENGTLDIRHQTQSETIAIGYQALNVATTNVTQSLFLGVQSGRVLGASTSTNNTVVGNYTLWSSTGGANNNTAIGNYGLFGLTTGDDNLAMGSFSLTNMTIGARNVAIGGSSGRNSDGYDNVFIGYQSGYLNVGQNNIFLGSKSGYNETGSNRLYVEPTNSANPLIYGEFDNDLVRVNGDFEVEQSGAVASTASIINGTNTWNLLNTGASGDLVIEPQTIDGDVIFRDQTNDEWVVLDNTNKKIKIDEDDLVPTSETDMRIAGMQDNGTSREVVSVGIGDGLYYDSTTDEIASTFVSPNAGVFKDASLVIGSPTYEDYAEFTETIDLSAVYSISGDVITVAEAGVYFFSIAFEPNIVSGTTLNRVTLELNGSDYLERDYDELAQTITMTGYLNLSDDDELKLSIQQFPNGGTADDIQFTIHRVGIAP